MKTVIIALLLNAMILFSGCHRSTSKDDAAGQASLLAEANPQRIAGTFVCDGLPTNSLELTSDGSFTIREAGQVVTGTYTINNRAITLQPSSGGPAQMGQIDGDGFLDPHGSRWSRKKP